ncbi:MAG: hypothetical protein ACPH9O_10020 [Akkermansiaceae bacterium]
MKKVLSLITIVGAIFAPLSAQADELTGFYKLSVTTEFEDKIGDVIIYQDLDGEYGTGKVFTNSNGKLRFSGSLNGYDEDEETGETFKVRIALVGIVNPTTGKIRIIKIGGIPITDPEFTEENFTINIRIIKRGDVVVGLTGSGSASWSETGEGGETIDFSDTLRVVGYKTRELPD